MLQVFLRGRIKPSYCYQIKYLSISHTAKEESALLSYLRNAVYIRKSQSSSPLVLSFPILLHYNLH